MKNTKLLALAAALSAGVSLPALAQGAFDRIGSVNFAPVPDREVVYGNFGGRVTAISLRSVNSDVVCDDVRATFNNGRTRSIYSGTLRYNRNVVVDLPGAERRIERIVFDCHSTAPRGSRVDIAADIGQYRAEWTRSPDWQTVWSRIFPWAGEFATAEVGVGNEWVRLGTERFDAAPERQVTLVGARGRQIDTIALRPVNNDARCSRASVTFANGREADLYVNRGNRLMRGQMYEVDLPGRNRNVTELNLVCRGEFNRPVTMQIFGNRTAQGMYSYGR